MAAKKSKDLRREAQRLREKSAKLMQQREAAHEAIYCVEQEISRSGDEVVGPIENPRRVELTA